MKTVKVWFLQKFKIIIYAFVAALMSAGLIYPTTINISELSVSPATVAPGAQITVSFKTSNDTNHPHCFAIGISPRNSAATAESYNCDLDWVASDLGIYARSTSAQTYWYDGGSTGTLSGLTRTIVEVNTGENICLPANGVNVPRSVTFVVNVPPEKAGTYYIVVAGHGNNSDDGRWECNDGILRSDTELSSALTISGATTEYKLDLEIDNKASTSCQIEIYYRVYNYSESSVPINDIAWQYYVNEGGAGTWSEAWGSIQKFYTSTGNLYGPDVSSLNTFTSLGSETNCGSSRIADWVYKRYWNVGAPGIRIAPGGGYVTNNVSQETALKTSAGCTIDQTDDYSRVSDNPTMDDNKYVTLYYKGVLQCEWDSDSTMDNLTGEEPCGMTGCYLRVAKSTSTNMATIGDTITFCITVTSTALADLETYIWDSVPAQTVFAGCDNGCTESGGSPDVVSWFVALAPGYAATRCFWVRIASYPFIIREGEFFAGVDFRTLESISRRWVYGINEWKYWMTAVNSNASKN